MTAQNWLQILMDDKPRPDQARIAKHHGEQPDDARHSRLVGELSLELGEIDLGLLARWVSNRTSKGMAGSAGRVKTRRHSTAIEQVVR